MLGKDGDPTDLFDKSSSIEFGVGIDGAFTGTWFDRRTLGPYFAGFITVSIQFVAGSPITTAQTVSAFCRRGTGEDSSCNPWVYGTGAGGGQHRLTVSVPGAGAGTGEANTSTTPAAVGVNEANINMAKDGVNLPKKKLVGGPHVTVMDGADAVTLEVQDGEFYPKGSRLQGNYTDLNHADWGTLATGTYWMQESGTGYTNAPWPSGAASLTQYVIVTVVNSTGVHTMTVETADNDGTFGPDRGLYSQQWQRAGADLSQAIAQGGFRPVIATAASARRLLVPDTYGGWGQSAELSKGSLVTSDGAAVTLLNVGTDGDSLIASSGAPNGLAYERRVASAQVAGVGQIISNEIACTQSEYNGLSTGQRAGTIFHITGP